MFKKLAFAFAVEMSLCFSVSSLAKTGPLKVVAPDLVVESFEFGKFPQGKGPVDDRSGKKQYEFTPSANNGAKKPGFGYGYRIRLKTNRKMVRLAQSVDKPFPHQPKKGEGKPTALIDGCIYDEWPLDGLKNGDYTVRVWLEDIELPRLNYKVAF